MQSKIRSLPLALLFTLLLGNSSRALTLTWTNSAGGSWNAAANWLPNLVPGPSDTAVIALQGNYTVTVGANTTVGGLTLGGGNLEINGSMASTNALVSGGKVMSGGAGVLNGTWVWTGGEFSAGGTLTLATNATLTVSPAVGGALVLQGTLTNEGAVVLSAGATLLLNGVSGQGQLVSDAGANITANANARISQQGYGSELFVNAGAVTAKNGAFTLDTQRGNGSGLFTANSGAAIDFVSNFNLTNGAVLNGAGTNLLAGGTITLSGSVASSNAVVAGASLTGANGILTGTWEWVGGALYGTLTLTGGAALNVETSTNPLVLYGSLTNLGSIDLRGTGTLVLNGVSGLGQLINTASGTVNGQGSVAFSHQGYGSEALINAGAIVVENGMLTLATTGKGAGRFTANTGATLNIGNDYTINAGGVVQGGGTVLLSAGHVTLNGALTAPNAVLGGATLLGNSGTISGSLTWTNGNIGAGSTLTVSSGGTLTVAPGGENLVLNGTLTNAGAIQLTGTGTLLLDGVSGGGVLINAGSANINAQGNVTLQEQGYVSEMFVNSGTVTAAAGTLTVNAKQSTGGGQFTADSGAVLNFANNYTATSGASLTGGGATLFSAGTITLAGGVTISNAVLAGATLAGTNGVISGTLTWTGGNIGAGGVVTIAPGATLNAVLTNNESLVVNGVVTNEGTINVSSNGILLLNGVSGGGVLVNASGAAINGQGAVGIKEQGYGSELFVNSGALVDQSGSLALSAKQGNGGGTFMADAGAALNFTDSFVLTEGAVLGGAGTNLLTGGTITLIGTVVATNAVLAGATLSGTNGVMAGTWAWTSGAIGAGGQLTVPTNGVLTVAPGGGTVSVTGSLTNAGTIALQGSGSLLLNGVQGGGALVNSVSGSINARGDVEIRQQGYGSETFINSGAVAAQNGTLTLATQSGSGTGRFTSSAGATLAFDNGFTLDNGASIGGGGTNLLNGGEVALNGDVTVTNTVLAGALLSGSGGVINGSLTWTGGGIAAGGALSVASGAVLTVPLTGNDTLVIAGSLSNAGRIQLEGNGTLLLNGVSGGGQLANSSAGTIDSEGGVSIAQQGYDSESFANAGVVTVGSGTLTVNSPRGGSTGRFDATAGTTLNIANNFTFGGGAVLAGAGTNLLSGGTVTLQGTVTSSNAVVAGSTLSGTNGVLIGMWDWVSGSIDGGSTLTVGVNGDLSIDFSGNDTLVLYGALTNDGNVQIRGNGTLLLDGVDGQGQLVNASSGEIETAGPVAITHQGYGSELFVNNGGFVGAGGTNSVIIAAPFVNAGVVYAQDGNLDFQGTYNTASNGGLQVGLNGLNDYGRVNFTGNAALGGSLGIVVNDGFLPAVGSQFTIVTYGAAAGAFSATNFPSGVNFGASVQSTQTVVTVLALVPGAPKIITGPLSQSISLGAGVTFTVDASGTAPLTYQWDFNGKALGSQTNSSLTLTGVQLIQAGAYSVVVSNALGSTVSGNALLSVLSPAGPVITGISVFGGSFSFSFGTQLALSYVVEYKNSLEDPSWTTLKLVTGTGASIQVSDSSAVSTRFYRIRTP